MFSTLVLVGLLLNPNTSDINLRSQGPRIPTPIGGPQTPKDKTPVGPPTPWFNKDEDTFDLPTDPKHLADLKRDVQEGKKEAAEVLKEEHASTNMVYQERVERIGQEIAHVANHTNAKALWGDHQHSVFHYRYTVLQGEDVNAFSLPGGYIFVYEGLLKFVESDDELAGVLGHETAHAAFRHVATLEHQADKAMYYQIPAIIASILSHSAAPLMTSSLALQSTESGWSIEAEKAADYGGFQFLESSHKYNPVAMLTFMERLNRQDEAMDSIVKNTIVQTHPITKERAEAMEADLKDAGIPIERSKASPTFRVQLKDCPDGSVDASFNSRKIYKFGGPDAKSRAQGIAEKLNHFYDEVPQAYDVMGRTDPCEITFKTDVLFAVSADDAAANKTTQDKLVADTVTAVKKSLIDLGYRVWLGPS
jgi:beta-barrel assembly-enhancing protease